MHNWTLGDGRTFAPTWCARQSRKQGDTGQGMRGCACVGEELCLVGMSGIRVWINVSEYQRLQSVIWEGCGCGLAELL